MFKSKHSKSFFMYVKDFSSDLEWRSSRKIDFTWRVSDCEELAEVTNRRWMGLV